MSCTSTGIRSTSTPFTFRRGQVDAKADWARISPQEFCRRYRRHTRLVLAAHRRRPDAVLLIRYEELTTDAEKVIRRLCRFVNEPFVPEALPSAHPDPDRWAFWEQSRHLYDEIKRHTKNWRDFCEPAVAAWIQEQLEPEMAALRYGPYELGGSWRATRTGPVR